ncbi:MAG: ABC transporter ATP-binding protein [Zestosphaera sp.]
MSEYVLQVRGLVKRRGGRQVLDNVSFSIKRGELFVILGPPGSGKTTLLKIIAGLVTQDSGDVVIDGKVVNDLPPYERGIALVFETLALYSSMSVYENIASPLIAERRDKEYVDRRVREIASLLKIEHILDRKADKLSGGERQRVAIARALAKEAEIYLLDEPFSNLDAKIRYALRTEFKKLKSYLGKTIVLATSDPQDALALGDKALLLINGAAVQEGKPSEIHQAPKNIYIARYLTGNLINEILITVDDSGRVSVDTGEDLSISSDVLNALARFRKGSFIMVNHVNTCIIDEHVRGCPGIALRGVFLGHEYRGSEYLLYARRGDRVFKSLRTCLPNAAIGSEVDICLTPQKALLFDSKSGELIGW